MAQRQPPSASGASRNGGAGGRASPVGYAVGAIGGAGVVLAAAADSVPLLSFSLLLYGSGTATNLQARYAGADLAPPDRRGRAVSTVLVATTLGAVIGPNLVEATGSVADAVGIRELAGPFMLATAAYALAAIAVLLLLRPDPLLTARAAADDSAAEAQPPVQEGGATSARTVQLAAAAMVLTQLVMVAVMTMTPVHMRDHGHDVGDAGLVISVHIAAMFLPSPLTGQLVDRIGRRPMLVAAGVTLLAALAPPGVDGSADRRPRPPRPRMELRPRRRDRARDRRRAAVPNARRRREPSISPSRCSGATGGMVSGFVVASTSYAVLSLSGGLLALALIPVLRADRRHAGSSRTAEDPSPA